MAPRRTSEAQHDCCSTNGRVRSKAAREEFCEGFYEMCEKLEPTRVVVVGILPEELDSPVEVINLENRAQKMRNRFSKNMEVPE